MTLPLTQQQEKLWRYIRSCERSPSFVEMQKAMGLSSKSGVHRLVEALRERGFVDYTPNRARTVVALNPPVGKVVPYEPVARGPEAAIIMIPLRGRIS
jgi:repressor LexA